MPNVITLDKGSKRRLRQIRWKVVEVFSLALLAVPLLAVSLSIMVWEVQHESLHTSRPTAIQSGMPERAFRKCAQERAQSDRMAHA